MTNKLTCGLVLFSVIMALTFGVAFAEMSSGEKTQKEPMNKTPINESLNKTMNKTMNQTMNQTMNETAKPAAPVAGKK